MVVGLGSAFSTDSIHAEPTTESIQNERADINEDISKAETEVKDIMVKIEKLNIEIEDLNKDLDKNEKSLTDTKNDISKKENEIEELEKEISKLEDKIEKRFDILKDRAVCCQKSGGDVVYLEVLVGSKTFGDFISRISAVTKINESDQELIEKQEADKKQVEENQEQIAKNLEELEENKKELKSMQKTIKEQKSSNKDKVSAAKETKKKLDNKIDDLKFEDRELTSLQADAEQQAREAENTAQDTAVASTTNSDNNSNSGSNDGGNLSTLSSSQGQSSSNNSTKPKNNTNKSTPKPSTGKGLIADAKSLIGTSYQLGGTTPSAFDCSGFTSYVFAQNGISLPRTAAGQYSALPKISKSQIQSGDLVFFSGSPGGGNITHVGISLGGSQFIGSQTSTGVAITSLNNSYWGPRFVEAARP